MEALEHMVSCRLGDRYAGIADVQENRPIVLTRRNPNVASRTIIFPSVLQQVLQDERQETFLSRDVEIAGKISVDRDVQLIGQRPQIIERTLDQLAQIDAIELDLKPSRVHARKKQQIFDHARKPI